MSARSGMTTLINQFRSLIGNAGTAVFTDDRVQEILDNHRIDFYQNQLTITPQEINNTVIYKVYSSQHTNLEGTASGSVAFRLYDSNGSTITSGFTFDSQKGRFIFDANQAGSARYLDGRSYDLYGAVADGWREYAGQLANHYDFRVEGRAFNRSQWFTHCAQMASYYDSLAKPSSAVIERNDFYSC